jgi:hypothetical protein
MSRRGERLRVVLAAAVALACFSACTSQTCDARCMERGDGSVEAGTDADSGAPDDGGVSSETATFTRVYNEIIVAKGCGSAFCHGAGMGDLLMDSQESAYMNLVGQPASGSSCDLQDATRVVAGDPDASLLPQKMSPSPPCGDTMPIGVQFDPDCESPEVAATCTTAQERELVRDWIAGGALDD